MAVCKVVEHGQQQTLTFFCPGCHLHHSVWVGFDLDKAWHWNGSLCKPTLTPSVLWRGEIWVPEVTEENLEQWKQKPWPQHKEARICHSFIGHGKIQFLSDCWHSLAGQTVALPEIKQ